MKINNGGLAFPVWHPDEINHFHLTDEGMSLRDYFAAKAMQGMLANTDFLTASGKLAEREGVSVGASVSKSAYAFADAMIKARDVQQ